ncbi:MAG: site-2 protease family protein [Candidatus Baldrarchaeia archaeon]
MIEAFIYILIFWATIAMVSSMIDLRKYNIEVYPFVLSFKTKRLNTFINKISTKYVSVWRKIWTVGVVISLCLMVFAVYLLIDNLVASFESRPITPVAPLIPGITITGYTLIYALLGITITAISHELAHGIAAGSEGLRVKSTGLIVIGVLFGAFVELDDREVKKLSPKRRLYVFSAGSASNVVIAFLFLALIATFPLIISPIYNTSPTGVVVVELVSDGPAYKAGITKGDVITHINNTPINGVNDLNKILSRTSPNDTVVVSTLRGNFTVRLSPCPRNSSRGYLGVYVFDYYSSRVPLLESILTPLFPYHIYETLLWTFMISFSVALFNMLPIPPFDGDRLLASILEAFNIRKNIRNYVRVTVACICTILLLLNIIFTFMSFGIVIFS